MSESAKAGLLYFAGVFAVGFVLGTIRVLVSEPLVGPVAAVVLELPVMLGVSWVVCRLMVRRFSVPARWQQRALMALEAFVLLMVAEFGMSILAFGRTPAEHLATYRQGSGVLGLLGQVAFALFPLLQLPRRLAPSETLVR